jgi:hypothetical protein
LEVTYVLQSLYGVSGDRLAETVRALVSFPGVQIVDDCPSTFDRKLANKLEAFGLAAYF